MKQITFSRTGKRRFNRRVESMVRLFKQDERLFRREWDNQVRGWLGEVHRRARCWREGAEVHNAESAEGMIVQGRAHIFGVLDLADATLAACGKEIEGRVGHETRQLLTNECIRAVGQVCDGRLNYMVDHRVYRRARC